MIRTLLQYSKPFAATLLLAATAVTAASAQAQDKRAVLLKKTGERVVGVEKTAHLQQVTNAQTKRREIAVGEKTGGSQEVRETVEVTRLPRQKDEARKRMKEPTDVMKQPKKEVDGPIKEKRRVEELKIKEKRRAEELRRAVERPAGAEGRTEGELTKKPKVEIIVPHKTKDAIGSPQKTEQRREAADLKKRRLIEQEGSILKRKEASVPARKRAEQTPALIRKKL